LCGVQVKRGSADRHAEKGKSGIKSADSQRRKGGRCFLSRCYRDLDKEGGRRANQATTWGRERGNVLVASVGQKRKNNVIIIKRGGKELSSSAIGEERKVAKRAGSMSRKGGALTLQSS